MAYNGQPQTVSIDQYNYALTNFRIAHDEVEKQRRQLEEQERQVALLRDRISTLEGTKLSSGPRVDNRGTTSVDDQSIRHAASRLAAQINRWAGEIVRSPPAPLAQLKAAILTDLYGSPVSVDPSAPQPPSIQVQNLLRHILSDAIAEGIVNCLIVTNSAEANVHLTRIHDQLFSRDPLVACVWRRQTFSAAVESFTPEMGHTILSEHLLALSALLQPSPKATQELHEVLNSAYSFSRMLHAGQSAGGMDAFYRAFVPELGHPLDPSQLELTRRCVKSERGEVDVVGATVFPGLVKVTLAPGQEVGKEGGNTVSTVVKRAQVICQCALTGGIPTPAATPAI